MIPDLSNPTIQQFIQDHLYDDPASLMLQAGRYPELPMAAVVEQIQSRRKAKTKLPEWFATEGIIYPPRVSMEQCSSEATALYKAGLVKGTSLVDLTGGFGVDTYFLGKGFERVHYLERQEVLAERARQNFQCLNADHIQVHHSDSIAFLKASDDHYSVIYVDPARRGDANQKVFRFEDCEPDLVNTIDLLRAKADQVLVKASPMLEIKQGLETLGGATQVHVVAVQNEVKEVLFLIDQNAGVNPEIHCVNLKSGNGPFTFDYASESEAEVQFAEVEGYLYEPNAAIMKAGGFNSVALAHSLQKLHPNTHLYTANHSLSDFPGKVFKVLDRLSMSKKEIKKYFPQKKANITTRNFPMTVAQIRKKTGLKEGGTQFLIGLMDTHGAHLLLAEKTN